MGQPVSPCLFGGASLCPLFQAVLFITRPLIGLSCFSEGGCIEVYGQYVFNVYEPQIYQIPLIT